ncbi:hypothetical protein ACIBCM_31595 [Streptomyces sp. NPDC051018]|uniref:hypothetical protein n=1 Tax=Streptomyces sp. NPDC051018 TaxID=3365639 RepID=UPI0037B6117D
MFELLPGTGLLLPHQAGTLRFGMSAYAAQWAVSMLCELRPGHVPGAAWAFSGEYLGLTIRACGADEGPHANGLGYVELARVPRDGTGAEPVYPSLAPVVHNGVDLFGHPRDEVAEYLPASARVNHGTGRPGGYVQSIGLRSPLWEFRYG